MDSKDSSIYDLAGVPLQIPFSLKQIKEVVQQIVTRKISTANGNKVVYESEDVVGFYMMESDLQEPEATVLNELRNRLPNMSMLDIGVGAGRTTTHFACLAREYLGIDYSNKMINACLEKFQNNPQISFLNADARNMKLFKDSSFDFVLFSYNGIDYVDHVERIAILREIRRLIRPEGYFCFSTHNLNFLVKQCSVQLSTQPFLPILLLQMRLLNKRAVWKIIRNPSRNQQHLMVNDGTHDFRLKTYYITPVEQLKQLVELGYSNTKMYSLDGREIKNPNRTMDCWVYFLSKTPEHITMDTKLKME